MTDAIRDSFVAQVAGGRASETTAWDMREGAIADDINEKIKLAMGEDAYGPATVTEQGHVLWGINAQDLMVKLAGKGVDESTLTDEQKATLAAAANILGATGAMRAFTKDGMKGLVDAVTKFKGGKLAEEINKLDTDTTDLYAAFPEPPAPASDGVEELAVDDAEETTPDVAAESVPIDLSGYKGAVLQGMQARSDEVRGEEYYGEYKVPETWIRLNASTFGLDADGKVTDAEIRTYMKTYDVDVANAYADDIIDQIEALFTKMGYSQAELMESPTLSGALNYTARSVRTDTFKDGSSAHAQDRNDSLDGITFKVDEYHINGYAAANPKRTTTVNNSTV